MKGDLYMHTLDGDPAEFDPVDKRVCRGMRRIVRFAASYEQLRREQRQSAKFYGDANTKSYGYVRIARSALTQGVQHD